MGGLLLKDGCVLSLDRNVGNLRRADVLVTDGVVAEIGSGLRARDAEVVDATDTIVLPGFVDTHRHLWKTLFRKLADDGVVGGSPSLGEYARNLEPEDVYAATLIGLLGAAASGTTTVVDHADIQVDDRYTEATLQAHRDAGLRTVLVHAAPAWGSGPDLEPLRRAAADLAGSADERTTLAFGAPDHPPAADVEEIRGSWASARELGLRIHIHVGVDPSARGFVAELARAGLLADDVTLVHASHLGDEDLDAIAAHGPALALTPANEMVTGMGPPPLQALIDRGIRPGLGIEDDVLAPSDLFAQMRSVQSLQRATVFDLKLAGKAGLPDLLNTREVLRYATIDGARVAGLAEVTGSLTPGKQADLVVLRTDRPNVFPINDPIGAVVWGMDASNVDWVLVGGRPIVRGGVLDTDVAPVRDLAIAAARRLRTEGSLLEAGDGGTP